MKKLLVAICLMVLASLGQAQIVTLTPSDATAEDEATITFDATEGTAGLVGAEKVYIHAGVILEPNGTSWENVVGNWGQDDGIGEMTKVDGESDKWEFTFSPTIKSYFSVADGVTVFRLAMVFRNADGTAEGKADGGNDIFIDLEIGDYVNFDDLSESYRIVDGESISLNATASAEATSFDILVDEGSGFVSQGTAANVSSHTVSYTPTVEGNVSVKASAIINGETVENTTTIEITLRPDVVVESIPDGIVDGVNYGEDDTKVTLSLLAPGKDYVYVVGDFTDWELDDNYYMKQDDVDPERFWLEISGLTPGEPYVFQYWIDDIKIGDPYATQVADPWNDQWIPEEIFPDIPAYDKSDYQIASVLQTGKTPFEWDASEDSWVRPDKEELVVYEMLVRDFVGSHSYQDVIDTLGYLKKLGVNAIELMPIMEFEGNESWGYNPMYFFAVDKYYGTENDLKEFIQAAHQEGMAVILDMVLNHAFGLNAMVKMHWDANNNTVSEDSPWFNPHATHPFNVGFDFNHESLYTQKFVDDVNRYWVEEFHFDGYRFDLSKGFTQVNNPNDVGAWGSYDQSRIDLLTRMSNKLWEVDPEAYVILEHFAEESEENQLRANGMMTWGNNNHDYRDALKGTNTSSTFPSVDQASRVAYMESHDEERLVWDMRENGRTVGSYDVSSKQNFIQRTKLGAAFFFTLPGPKMMWQFQELGYDIAIDYNGRTGNKPLPWGTGSLEYYEDEDRYSIYEAYADIINLRMDYPEVFRDGEFEKAFSTSNKRLRIFGEDKNVVIIGNFWLEEQTAVPGFTQTGDWFDYETGLRIPVDNVSLNVDLQPGEYKIYTDWPIKPIIEPEVPTASAKAEGILVYPTVSSKSVSIKLPEQLTPGSIQAISIDGRVVDLKADEKTGNDIQVDVSALQAGIYILKINAAQFIYSTKIIKR